MNRRGASNEMEKSERENPKKMRMQKFSEGQLTHSSTSVVIEKKNSDARKERKKALENTNPNPSSLCVFAGMRNERLALFTINISMVATTSEYNAGCVFIFIMLRLQQVPEMLRAHNMVRELRQHNFRIFCVFVRVLGCVYSHIFNSHKPFVIQMCLCHRI